jgi:hypothetical protein
MISILVKGNRATSHGWGTGNGMLILVFRQYEYVVYQIVGDLP